MAYIVSITQKVRCRLIRLCCFVWQRSRVQFSYCTGRLGRAQRCIDISPGLAGLAVSYRGVPGFNSPCLAGIAVTYGGGPGFNSPTLRED